MSEVWQIVDGFRLVYEVLSVVYESIGERERMTEQGFIKLHRSILKWEWYSDEHTKSVFLHLLINAQWEDSRYKGHEVPKGSLVIGRKKLARELNLTERQVRTSLEHLKSTNEITIKTTNQFSIISIVNWEKYQCVEEKTTNKTTNNKSNERPTTDHIKEYKERKNKEYFISDKENARNKSFLEELDRENKNGKH